MITAVSLNPAIDRTMTVPGFTAGTTNRAASSRTDPGGKGINVARAVKRLGGPVQVLGFLGANNGALHTSHLAELAIPTEFIAVPGDTRVNVKVIAPESHELTEINDAGFAVSAGHLSALIARAETLLASSAVLVLAGSLPAGVPADIYRALIAAANRAGVPAIVDADGEALARALPARPALIKPNRAEAERLLGRRIGNRVELANAARELLAGGAQTVVISSGGEGAMLASAQGIWWATPPVIEPGSTVGAGDSMVAALAIALARGMAPEQALRLATAAGTATASLAGTQVCDTAGVEALLPGVSVTPIS